MDDSAFLAGSIPLNREREGPEQFEPEARKPENNPVREAGGMDFSPIFPAFLFNPAWSPLVAAPPRYALRGFPLPDSGRGVEGVVGAREARPCYDA